MEGLYLNLQSKLMVNIYQKLSHVHPGLRERDAIVWCYKINGEWL